MDYGYIIEQTICFIICTSLLISFTIILFRYYKYNDRQISYSKFIFGILGIFRTIILILYNIDPWGIYDIYTYPIRRFYLVFIIIIGFIEMTLIMYYVNLIYSNIIPEKIKSDNSFYNKIGKYLDITYYCKKRMKWFCIILNSVNIIVSISTFISMIVYYNNNEYNNFVLTNIIYNLWLSSLFIKILYCGRNTIVKTVNSLNHIIDIIDKQNFSINYAKNSVEHLNNFCKFGSLIMIAAFLLSFIPTIIIIKEWEVNEESINPDKNDYKIYLGIINYVLYLGAYLTLYYGWIPSRKKYKKNKLIELNDRKIKMRENIILGMHKISSSDKTNNNSNTI